MKRLSVVLLIASGFSLAGAALGQDSALVSSSNSAKLFPRGWVRGYTDFAVAPPHNEPDLNRCMDSAGVFGGAGARCTAFARFIGSGYIELQPLNTTSLRRVFVFGEPRLFLGRNVPQYRYSISASPMAFDRSIGVGVELAKNLELRLTEHRVEWMGRYRYSLGQADLGKNGPLGVYTTVSARWYFGGYKIR